MDYRTGKILQTAFRRSDIIELILLLWLSGLYLFWRPYLAISENGDARGPRRRRPDSVDDRPGVMHGFTLFDIANFSLVLAAKALVKKSANNVK